jgi:hypothetical protein
MKLASLCVRVWAVVFGKMSSWRPLGILGPSPPIPVFWGSSHHDLIHMPVTEITFTITFNPFLLGLGKGLLVGSSAKWEDD